MDALCPQAAVLVVMQSPNLLHPSLLADPIFAVTGKHPLLALREDMLLTGRNTCSCIVSSKQVSLFGWECVVIIDWYGNFETYKLKTFL